jgi:type VI secretion system protein ImpH
MAPADRRQVPAVAEALRREPYRFAFFQAVRLLRLWHKRAGARGEEARFEVPLSLQFPASEIDGLAPGEADQPAKLRINFVGLTGPSGVLPRHYTSRLIERRIRHRDETAQRFFDIFHHRLARLFYQAWEKHHFYVAYERGEGGGVTHYLLDLVGLGPRGLRGRAAAGVRDEHLGHFAGLVRQQPRSLASVGAALSGLFAAPVEVMPLRGHWLVLRPQQRSRLGLRNARPGVDLLLGDRVWDHQNACRIRIGPIGLDRFVRLLPGGKEHEALLRAVRFLLGLALKVDAQLVLRREEVPRLQLGGERPSRLGLDTWLKTDEPFRSDADDVVLAVGQREAA